MRPSGEFGATLEAASTAGSSELLTGPEQNLWALTSAPKRGKDQPEWIPFSYNLATGTSQTFFSESGIPDYWYVSVVAAAAVLVSVSGGPNANPNGYLLSGGGDLKIPGFSEYITITSLGTTAARGNVVAGRGYKDMYIDPGNLA